MGLGGGRGERQYRSWFPAAPTSAPRARDWARSVLSGWGLEGAAPDALLVLTELLGNAVRHGRGPVEVVLSRRGEGVRLEVSDTGPGQVRRSADPAPRDTGGRGLLIVEALSAGWGVRYDSAGKVVWAELQT